MILPLLCYILTLNVVLICAVFHQKIHKNVGNIFVQLSNNLLEILVEIQIFAIKDVFEILLLPLSLLQGLSHLYSS